MSKDIKEEEIKKEVVEPIKIAAEQIKKGKGIEKDGKYDREIMEEILNNQRKILKEIRYNRFAYGIIMMLIITYIYFEMKKFGDILGTLIEIFLPT